MIMNQLLKGSRGSGVVDFAKGLVELRASRYLRDISYQSRTQLFRSVNGIHVAANLDI